MSQWSLLGLRAWVTIACPVFAKAALGVIVSSALLCVSFIEHLQQGGGGELLDGFVKNFPLSIFNCSWNAQRETPCLP